MIAPPGTGKTFCINLLVAYMQEVLGWTPGIEFQTVASQNRMAMRVGGNTMHHWGEVPIDLQKACDHDGKRAHTTGATDMYTKCEVLRILLIDEISTASLHVLGTMEKASAEHAQVCYGVRILTANLGIGAASILPSSATGTNCQQ